MRSTIFVLAALAAAVAGWAIAPFGGERGTSGLAGRAAPASSELRNAPAEGVSAVAPPPAATDPEAVETTSAESPAASATELTDLVALLARFPAREYPRGDGAITGTVVRDEDGAPLAGIAIDAIIHGTTPGAEPKGVEQGDLLAYIREEIDQYHYDIAMTRRAVTDAEGRFRLEGILPDERYRLLPSPSEEWLVWLVENQWGYGGGDEVTFRATRSAIVAVEVFDANGAPVENGMIHAGPGPDNSTRFSSRLSPASSEIRVPTPRGALWVSTDAGSTDEIELELAPGERRSVRVTIQPSPGIDVLVIAEDPIDRFGAIMAALPLDGPPFPDAPSGASWADDDERAHHDRVEFETGEWEADLEPGPYLLRLSRDGEILHEETLLIGAERQTLEIPIPPRPSSLLAHVRVLGPEGEPARVDSFLLRGRAIRSDGEAEELRPSDRSHDLGGGRHAIIARPLPSSEEESGVRTFEHTVEHTLEVEPSDYGTIVVPIRLGAPGFQEIRLPEPIEVTVDLLGYVGHELQGRVALQLRGAGADPDSGTWGTIDPLGRARFGLVSGGIGRLRLTAGDRWNQNLVLEREIAVSAAARHFTLALPDLHALRVRSPHELAGRSLALRQEDGEEFAEVTIGEDGLAEFSDLPPGRYLLALAESHESMPLRIPGESEIRFEPIAADALRVEIEIRSGWLARAGLRDGDRVVGVVAASEATEVAKEENEHIEPRRVDARRLRLAVMRAIAGGRSALVVERGEMSLRLPLPGGVPPHPDELGGEFVPDFGGGAP